MDWTLYWTIFWQVMIGLIPFYLFVHAIRSAGK